MFRTILFEKVLHLLKNDLCVFFVFEQFFWFSALYSKKAVPRMVGDSAENDLVGVVVQGVEPGDDEQMDLAFAADGYLTKQEGHGIAPALGVDTPAAHQNIAAFVIDSTKSTSIIINTLLTAIEIL